VLLKVRGRSRAEFEAKLGTVFEEADECVGHLQMLHGTDETNTEQLTYAPTACTFPLSLLPLPHFST
jgi:hypothetical protein